MDKEKRKKIIIVAILFIIAFIIRLIYIINTPITEHQHDVDVGNDFGHFAYILTIYETNQLPDTNAGQFYQPPLHYIVSALWLKAVDGIIQDTDILYESLQVVTLIYSMLLIFVVYKILKELNIKDKYQYLILFVMAFHPTFIILSGSINNDLLSILLIFTTMYFLIKWYKKQDMKNTIILAIFTGLAVMAKSSGAIVSIPIIYIFLLQLYRKMKKSKQKKKVLMKYFILFFDFGMISLSIGLWYQIRNLYLFDQDILYILDLNMSSLYVGDCSLFRRLFPVSSEITTLFAHPYEDCNIPTYIIKTSLFGEWEYSINNIIWEIIYWLAILSNIILIIFSLFSMIQVMFKKFMAKGKEKKDQVWCYLFFILYIVNIVSFISMNLELPYGCSMDFRYIVSSIFVGMYFIVYYLNSIKQKKAKKNLELFVLIMCFILVLTSNGIILN